MGTRSGQASGFERNLVMQPYRILTRSMAEGCRHRLLRRVSMVGDCWEWGGCVDKKGYGVININKKAHFVHRVAYELFRGHCGSRLICHKCDNPCCINPEHLFAGTHADNNWDRTRKGRSAPKFHHGDCNPNAILTVADVLEIRRLYRTAHRGPKGKLPNGALRKMADAFGVHVTTFARAASGRGWQLLSAGVN